MGPRSMKRTIRAVRALVVAEWVGVDDLALGYVRDCRSVARENHQHLVLVVSAPERLSRVVDDPRTGRITRFTERRVRRVNPALRSRRQGPPAPQGPGAPLSP